METNPYVFVSDQLVDIELTLEQRTILKVKEAAKKGRQHLRELQKTLEDQIQELADKT